MRKIHLLFSILGLSIGLHVPGSLRAQGPPVYVSTFGGGQILRVDGTTGATAVIDTDALATPEDIVVGADGKIYICDSEQNRIRRMNEDGTQVETVYTKGESSGPTGPEGPSVSTGGDLFFNTRDNTHTGIWKIAGVFAIPSGGLFPAPVQVLTATQTGSTFGEGTTFDQTDALLVVDRSGSTVVKSAPPFTSTSTLINANLSTPVGIAVDSAGDIFVASLGSQNINRFNSSGVFQATYVTFAVSDEPFYLQFDASDKLYVATNDGSGANGKIWRVDPVGSPPATGTATLLIDLGATFSPCAPNPCPSTSPVPGLASGQAVGLGLPATTFTTGQQAIFPGGSNTFSDGTITNEMITFPADANMGGAAFKAAKFIQIPPAVFNSSRLPGTTQSPNWSGGTTPLPAGTSCTPIAGTGGNCIVIENLCFDANHAPIIPCNITAPTALIQLASHYKTQAPQPNPAMGLSDDGATNWANVTNFFDPSDPRIGGGTSGENTDIGIFNLGGSSLSFTYNACLLYDPSHAVKSGAAIPLKMYLCDPNSGRDLSSASVVVHAQSLVKTSNTTTDLTIMDSGNSNPDSDFRFDPTLGPNGGYIFNLKTTGLSTGTYELFFTAGFDPTPHLLGAPNFTFTFQVK